MFTVILTFIFTYYFLDAIRVICLIVFIQGAKAFGLVYALLQIVEFLGIGTMGVLFYYRT